MHHVLALGLTLILFGGMDAAPLERRTWVVGGVSREALVHVPATVPGTGAPLVFAFHGHGGSMTQASRSFPIHQHWPEAIVVYPQGLPTPGQLTDKEGNEAGWQGQAGLQGDRDLKFFDAMLADLRQRHVIDDRRVYSTGHSNGGGFTYLLWAERGGVFAAMAPSAAVLSRGSRALAPKPMLQVASPQDSLVRFAWQERMIARVLALNGCDKFKPGAMGYTTYPSKTGNDVAIYLHAGGHRYPGETAPELIVKFFQAHPGR
ncbi:MAG: esterase [Opitutae bacterium]|nr:esterase [Opitutae bacterium]